MTGRAFFMLPPPPAERELLTHCSRMRFENGSSDGRVEGERKLRIIPISGEPSREGKGIFPRRSSERW
jgi:hypothetical protein